MSNNVAIILARSGSKGIPKKNIVDFCFSEGVDVVIGSHPHVVQPFHTTKIKDKFGVEKERIQVYSRGNFVSNQRKRYVNGGITVN